MAIVRAQISGVANLAAWLNANATHLLQKVEYSALDGTYYGYDLDGKKVFGFASGSFKAYRTDGGNPISITQYVSGLFNDSNDIIMCDNGIIIETTYTYSGNRKFALLITKTNNARIACVFTQNGDSAITSYLYTQLNHVAIGDSTTIATTTTFAPEAGQQACLVPFATNAEIGDTSYTPDAFYIIMSPNYAMGIGKFLMGADTYISNGYWAIREGS